MTTYDQTALTHSGQVALLAAGHGLASADAWERAGRRRVKSVKRRAVVAARGELGHRAKSG